MRALPNDEPKACKKFVISCVVFVAVDPDDFLIVLQDLVRGKLSILSLKSRNLFAILVLEMNVPDPIWVDCTSDLFYLGVEHDWLEIVCVLVFAQEDWRRHSIWVSYLDGTNCRRYVWRYLPLEFTCFNKLVSGHGKDILVCWVPEVWFVTPITTTKQRQIPHSFNALLYVFFDKNFK